MPNPNLYKYARGFDKLPQNINRTGANRRTIGKVNKELEDSGITEATPNEIKSCYLRLINNTIPELTKLIKDETQPALVRIVGKAIIQGKGLDIIEKVLDRAIGKAVQQIEQTNTDNINITLNLD